MQRRRFGQAAMALASMAAAPRLLAAEDPATGFPDRPIRLMIPFEPGGGTDIVGRAIAQKTAEALEHPIVVENRSGANGTIGAAAVARAAPDGYNWCMFTASHSVNVTLQGKKQSYDLLRDFDPLIQLAVQPYILVVRPGLPVHTVGELIAMAKAKPDALTFGSSGVGGLLHLSAELLSAMAGIKMIHVPYKGGAQAMMDVMAGNVDMMFTSLNQSKSYIASGQLRLLAVTSPARSPALPNTPSLDEAGVRGYEVQSWYGFAVPAGTPAPIVAKANHVVNRVLELPDIQRSMAADGSTPVGGTPAAFGRFLSNEVVKWRDLIDKVGIPVG
ncbi:tripartite tricarboxylate transporter substrate binding protein [Bordetella sp. BOR01]|uniref:Bug family tripartite tricarboxylate transporter substrate binding protein n=1 Tax=Bordetella sp. BOR01 TaxID=2854779 RepID=UPI001C44E7BD|nr:tripartite tricarboxylate transporter substrate binding protein [Bordetella sp. BOR01]MBV7482215.1 tripartite tricarboxylate transporter substrate binding protein [Bordetella sp. BOR01]